MTLETGVQIGKYTVGQKLGQGGFGILYIARDTELERDIAIKFLRPEHAFKQQVVQRFLQEARAAARITHPGIVTVYESGIVSDTHTRADGTVYIAMELLAGDTLAQRIKQNGRLPTGIAIGMCRQMADALAAAHAAGIIHRDLKPQNIFLVRDPAVVGGERVKVLDFGIAKLADNFGGAVQTHSLVMLGTPMYMSPEQCKSSAKVDARSDIYSLGCILFEMLTGRTPFDGDSGELIAKHQLIAPPTARSVVSDLPSELDTLVAAMLAKSPDERPQTMNAVIDVLDAIEDRIAPAPGDATGEGIPALRSSLGSMETLPSNPAAIARHTGSSRTRLVAVAAAAIGVGILGGVVAMRDDDTPPAAAAAASLTDAPPDADVSVAADAAMSAFVPEEPSADLDQLVIECRRAAAASQWAACIECAAKVARVDEMRGVEMAAICKDTSDPEIQMADDVIAQGTQPTTTKRPPRKTTPAAAPASCDAEATKEKGMANINMGQHAAALAQFEASLRCKDDAYVRQLAFMEACASSNPGKATLYYAKLTRKQQEKFAPICDRQKPPVPYTSTAGCDAVKLKEKGMAHINAGQHAAALSYFEASLRCKDDPYVAQLAFMESCASANSQKAKLYYKELTPAQQAKFAQVCIRQKPPVAYE